LIGRFIAGVCSRATSGRRREKLASASDADLIKIKGIGSRSVNGIRGLLSEAGHKGEEGEEDEEEPKRKLPDPRSVKGRVGPANVAGKTGQVKSLINAVFPNWEGEKYSIVINEIIKGGEKEFPEGLVDYMVEREEALEI